MLFSLTGACREVYYINFVRTHAPKQCKRHKRDQRDFQLTGSALGHFSSAQGTRLLGNVLCQRTAGRVCSKMKLSYTIRQGNS